MPLLRIETRNKPGRTGSPRQPGTPSGGGRSAMPAIVLGVVAGLALIAGFVAFQLGRGSPMQGQPAASSAPTQVVTHTLASAASSLPSAGADLAPINLDFPREATVALVNGVPFTMGQLEVAVRVGRTLGQLSGEDVPGYTDDGMLDFQRKMLRRQVDILLMKQAFKARGLEEADLPLDGLISAYLERVGATQEDLKVRMAENAVTSDWLTAWFQDSQTVNQFVQQELMQGRDQSEREQVASQWLADQWDQAEIYVTFYDPDSNVWSPPSTATTGVAPGSSTEAGSEGTPAP